jgi:CRISPR-associated exonuclease Cas4
MELLVLPELTWSKDASWAKHIDFKLADVPELKLMHLPRGSLVPPATVSNTQTVEAFATEQSRLESAFFRVRWIRPSDSDPDVGPIQLPILAGEDEPLQAPVSIEGSRMRGVILHKLMEELLTQELEAIPKAVQERARQLLDQLMAPGTDSTAPDPQELASTALRTLALPALTPYRDRLIAEVPIYGPASKNADEFIVGRADAIANAEDGTKLVFDWKRDVAPSDAERAVYARQLVQYLHVIGSQRGAIVYMTSGHIDWVSSSTGIRS